MVAVLVPPEGVASVPLREPFVVAAVVERLRTTSVPAPALGLLTTSAPVAAPRPAGSSTVRVPALTVEAPAYVLAAVIVSVPVPFFVNPPPGDAASGMNGVATVMSKPLV